MLERYCDTLIIGTELPGLITGAFLARRGLTVHVLDIDLFARNEKEPDPFCVAHLHSKLLRSILGRLNIPENDIQWLQATDSPLQVIFPDKRIDLASNPVTFYEELEREFPADQEKLKLFYENLARIKHEVETQQLYSLILPTSFRERRQLKKFAKAHGLDTRLSSLDLPLENNPALKSFIMAQLKLITQTHVDSPFSFQVAELLNPTEGEILSIQGGHHFLKKLFLERIQGHEGAYRPDATIEALLFKNGIFEGVKLSGFEGELLARYIIWNAQLKKLPDFLPKLFRFRKLKKAVSRVKPAAHWFTAHYAVPKSFLPPPMKENIIYLHDAVLPLFDTNFLYIQVKDTDRETAKLSVSYLMEPSALEADEERFAPVHEKILEVLRELIPFADNRLTFFFPKKAEEAETEGTLFPLRDNDFEIFRETAREHPVYSLQPKSFTDLFPLSFKTAAPNLFVTAPEILGSLGYEGKYMLGLKVTDLIWQDVEKEKKRAMKQERRIA